MRKNEEDSQLVKYKNTRLYCYNTALGSISFNMVLLGFYRVLFFSFSFSLFLVLSYLTIEDYIIDVYNYIT